MYAIFTKTGGFHAPHGDGSRRGMAGYKLRYVMKVGSTGKTGKTGRIHLKMKGEEEMAYEYEAAYSMDAATGSSPNKHRVAPVAAPTCVLVASVYGGALTPAAAAKAIEAASTVPPQRFSLKAVKVEPTGLKATTKANIGNTFALGVKHTAATKAKMSAAQKGKKHTAATKAKMSAAVKGKKRTAATKAKISAAVKGKKRTAATKAKMSAARKGKKGVKRTAATKAKMSAAKKGKKHTAATKAKISAAMKGKKRTAATKAKMSAAMKGNTNRMKKR